MKLTKTRLKQIIREEIQQLNEWKSDGSGLSDLGNKIRNSNNKKAKDMVAKYEDKLHGKGVFFYGTMSKKQKEATREFYTSIIKKFKIK